MHQIRFRLGLCLRPRWGEHTALPNWNEGELLLREREEQRGKGEQKEGKVGEKREGKEESGGEGITGDPRMYL